jgi:hypothetical protein
VSRTATRRTRRRASEVDEMTTTMVPGVPATVNQYGRLANRKGSFNGEFYVPVFKSFMFQFLIHYLILETVYKG